MTPCQTLDKASNTCPSGVTSPSCARRLSGLSETPCATIAYIKATTCVNHRPAKCRVDEYTLEVQGLIAYLEGMTRMTRPISIPAFLNRHRPTMVIKTTMNNSGIQVSHGGRTSAVERTSRNTASGSGTRKHCCTADRVVIG
jgi:hypothetical protein